MILSVSSGMLSSMTGGVDISNLPNILLSAVRRSTSARTGSGMNL